MNRLLAVIVWTCAAALGIMATLTAVGYLTGPEALPGFLVCASGAVLFVILGAVVWSDG